MHSKTLIVNYIMLPVNLLTIVFTYLDCYNSRLLCNHNNTQVDIKYHCYLNKKNSLYVCTVNSNR